MNLILLKPQDYVNDAHVRLSDDRFTHITTVLKSAIGDSLTVGSLNGLIGTAQVVSLTSTAIDLKVTLNQHPPKPLPLTVIMPMVRPPMFKRMLFHATTFGVKRICVVNFNRVEKSLWTSSSLTDESIQEQLMLGLSQAKDTILPAVTIHRQFKPFVEDELPALSANSLKLVAHPAQQPCPYQVEGQVTVVIGPEGGIIPFELDLLEQVGFKQVNLGVRILRVDMVLPFFIGKLF